MRSHGRMKAAVVLLIAVTTVGAAFAAYRIMDRNKAADDAEKVLDVMKDIIPGFGTDTGTGTGDGRDSLSVMTINNVDVVGCLEIPSIDLMIPVTAKGKKRSGFAEYVSGSALKGKLRISGARSGVYRRLSSVKPGAKAAFTDVDGVRYTYSVLTQFHLKKWDKADYDLMLTYKTDSDTDFVVGCRRE